ncbi:MAG: DUF3187 family protein [Candidatus Sulfomarinibacteraceae bacterium]
MSRKKPQSMASIPFVPLLVAVVFAFGDVAAEDLPHRVSKRDNAIAFTDDLDAALDRARSTGTPVYLAFGAAWCPICQRMERITLLDRRVQAFADDFVWVKIDIDRNVTLARTWGVEATPTIFLLDPDGAVQDRMVGEVPPDEMERRLDRALADPNAGPDEPDTDLAQAFRRTMLTVKPTGYRGRSVCFSHVGYGPLGIRSQSPFQSLRLGILPRTPSTLGRGQHQARLGATWANTWSNDAGTFDPGNGDLGLYLLDFESLDLSLSYAYGISDTLQIEAELEQRWHFGGVLDGFIEGFHDLFGLGQAGRTEFPRDQTNVFIDLREGHPPVELPGDAASGVISRSLLVTLQHNLTCGTAVWPALSWAVTVRTSLGNPGDLDGGSLDIALSAAASRRFGDFYAYLTVGYAWYGSDAVYGLELESTQATVLAALEWRFRPRMSLVLQYLGTQGVAKDLSVFSDPSNEVVLGWKWEARDAGVLEVGLLENIIEFGNSPDFGVHAAWTQRF